MSYQQRDNSGTLFKNQNKDTDKHPDYTGSALVDGVDYFMDAWINTAESGRQYMSFRFKAKDKQSATQPPRPSGKTHGDRPGGPKNRMNRDESEDIPF